MRAIINRERLGHDAVCTAAKARIKASQENRDAEINSARQMAQESRSDVKRLEQTVTQLKVASKAGMKALKGGFSIQLTTKKQVITYISKGLLTAKNQDILLKRASKERDATKQLAAKHQKRILEEDAWVSKLEDSLEIYADTIKELTTQVSELRELRKIDMEKIQEMEVNCLEAIEELEVSFFLLVCYWL